MPLDAASSAVRSPARGLQRTSTPTRTTPSSRYTQAPSLQDALGGGHALRRGQQGTSVRQLQEALNRQGARLDVDGAFGPQTERALRDFQARQAAQQPGFAVDGLAGPQTLRALQVGPSTGYDASSTSARRSSADATGRQDVTRAPQQQQPTSSSGPRAGDLANADNQRMQDVRTGRTTAAAAPADGPDGRLASIQQGAVDVARRELDAGVREHGGRNRGTRVDQYARNAGMPVGGEWCGYFATHGYTEAARAHGGRFTGQHRLHSYQKARSYYLYRNYTNASRAEVNRNETLRTAHGEQGSQRRYMTFDGSVGDRYASARNLPHETYTSPRDLPIRAGDTALFAHGHIGMVADYNRDTGILTTIEGNVGNRVQERTYDLNDPAVRARFDGFGRPAAGDFTTE